MTPRAAAIRYARALFDVRGENARARKRTADHERVFWSLSGYCLRPGFGHPLDPERARLLEPLFAERLAFAGEVRGWQQFWIAWRRVAGGLSEASQTEIRAPASRRRDGASLAGSGSIR